MTPSGSLRSSSLRLVLCAATTATLLAGAQASDRPFVLTSSAAAEEDDDNVWSVETVYQRVGSVRAITFAPEYAFSPTRSIQFELTRARDGAAGETEVEAEIEFKQLFNHIARDGYGWGLVAAVGFGKAPQAGWRRSAWAIAMPASLQLGEGGTTLLHANAGWVKPAAEAGHKRFSLALEHEVLKRTVGFVELAREGGSTLLHGGARWWVKRERIALDLSWQRSRGDGVRESGWLFGLAFYDL